MSQNHKDPVTYLNEAVAKRGKSGHLGVYLHNVTVVTESEVDYGYKVWTPVFNLLDPFGLGVNLEWLTFLVNLRTQLFENQATFIDRDRSFQFLQDGGKITMNVFLPEVRTEHFSHLVVFSQDLLKGVANFSGKSSSTIRFNIGLAQRSWKDLVEEGEVEEVELTY